MSDAIVATLTRVIEEMVGEWELDLDQAIGPTTRLVEDLGFESIDLIQLMVAVEQAFGVRGLPYEQVFMQNGAYITEITVEQLAGFLQTSLPAANRL